MLKEQSQSGSAKGGDAPASVDYLLGQNIVAIKRSKLPDWGYGIG